MHQAKQEKLNQVLNWVLCFLVFFYALVFVANLVLKDRRPQKLDVTLDVRQIQPKRSNLNVCDRSGNCIQKENFILEASATTTPQFIEKGDAFAYIKIDPSCVQSKNDPTAGDCGKNMMVIWNNGEKVWIAMGDIYGNMVQMPLGAEYIHRINEKITSLSTR